MRSDQELLEAIRKILLDEGRDIKVSPPPNVTGSDWIGSEKVEWREKGEFLLAPDLEPVCVPVSLPESEQKEAAKTAIDINPLNRPGYLPVEMLILLQLPGFAPVGGALTAQTTKYWGANGVRLTVSFMESIAADLRERILHHMNAWAEYCNVSFTWSQSDGQVRITRNQEGYWSYLGTDILQIARNRPTMCLQGFTMRTPESEFVRVVRHEAGHTLGFPHEHMRREIVELIDPLKAIEYFRRTQGWSAEMTRQQVLTPLEEGSLLQVPGYDNRADVNSIMCYQLPGSITRNGRPILGGSDIDLEDIGFVSKIYPKPTVPPPPPPPPQSEIELTLSGALLAGKYKVLL